ncbi:MAG: SNF2-related protein [Isosphaeraceae bacterium]|nr:SNF2-related protein [Isosphaeraceae bacterium]
MDHSRGRGYGKGQGHDHENRPPAGQGTGRVPRPDRDRDFERERELEREREREREQAYFEPALGIAPRIAREFSDAVRSRGHAYFAKNRVAVTASSSTEVVAKVRGTEKYRVRIRLRNGGRLLASCSCPYFSPYGDPCKHLWATVLMVDARNLLPGTANRPIKLVTDATQGRKAQGNVPGDVGPHGDGPPPYPRPIPNTGDGGPIYPPDMVIGHASTLNGHNHPHAGLPGHPPRGNTRNRQENGPKSNRGKKEPRGRGHGAPGVPPGRYPSTPGYGYGPPPGPGLPGSPPYRPYPPQGGPGAPPPPPGPGRPRPVRDADIHRERLKHRRDLKAEKQAARQIKRLLAYILDVPSTLNHNTVVVDLARRLRRPNGEWSPLKPWWHSPTFPQNRYDPEDARLLTLLAESVAAPTGTGSQGQGGDKQNSGSNENAGMRRFILQSEKQASIVENLARTGRLRMRRADGEDDPPPVRWDDRPPWRFGIDVRTDASGKRWSWRGILRRDDQKMDLTEPLVLFPGLMLQSNGRAARFDDSGIYLWMMRIRHEKEMVFTDAADQDEKLEKVLADAKVPPSDLIETLQLDEYHGSPRPCVILRTPRQNWNDRLVAEVVFDYGGVPVSIIKPPSKLAVKTELGRVAFRDMEAEGEAIMQLFNLGFKECKDHLAEPGSLELPVKRMGAVTKELVSAGWKVEAEGSLIHPAGDFKLSLTTGIDWFELGGDVAFGDQTVPLPEILAAAKRGETMIELNDGSMGMLPEEWLKKYGLLADMGTTESGAIRFGKAQAGLLDAMLAAQPEIKVDVAFGKVRQALPRFEGLQPREAPPGFRGELRPYQQEGLGWLEYLQKFEFGGILADDMGLGKTVQVLAFLQSRRARRLSKGPSLIVVPRSLVFNWKAEAEKFTPRLRVLDYTGPGRHALREEFEHHDLIITTYGVMRTDIMELSNYTFDYVILDEAQAIKNADSQAAKAARVLKGRHRLAMSGTPIENHIGELWSIFEFLNPGMLGTASVFKRHASGGGASDDSARSLLAKALRPFILRRTKQQVVKDLPDKTEQTLVCEMEPAQRKLYEDLKAHYRNALLRKDAADLNRSKIEVLEALLRLRQAACHPGLIDPARMPESSAKLDMLLPQLAEVVEEGHKVLIFSQFTSFLSIVREKIEAEGYAYEYLDGRTRNRAERVERFQNDPSIPIFLISLKAGGLGLNLTAAGYVYLLDPWWNPAVEAQAIDRSHRIGQTQHVFAYRLICSDTVEQKILDLQSKKRDLADAILNADNRMLSNLTRDDLEFLLS